MITLQDFCYEDLFKDLNLFIVKNKITVISGANNCGKTLLIRILNREIVTSNTVLIDQAEMNQYTIEEYSKLVQCIIPLEITYEQPTLEEEMFYYNDNKEEIEKTIKGLKLKRSIHKKIKDLTTKEIVLSQIAIALIKKSSIILLDNIRMYLTEKETKEVIEFLKKQQKEREITVVITTIHLEESLLADYLYIIGNKSVALEGQPIEVLQNDNKINKLGLSLPFMIDLSVKLKDYDLIKEVEIDKNRMIEKLWK